MYNFLSIKSFIKKILKIKMIFVIKKYKIMLRLMMQMIKNLINKILLM